MDIIDMSWELIKYSLLSAPLGITELNSILYSGSAEEAQLSLENLHISATALW